MLTYDRALIADLASRFDLREPNREALTKVIFAIENQRSPEQFTLDLATGVGKTYILAALLEYAATQGMKNLLVVVPGKTVRAKTIANFTPGAPGFIEGAEIPKTVITPQNFADQGQALADPNAVKLFLLNVQNLTATDDDAGYVAPDSAKARELRTARPQEALGGSLLDYLADADDLLMVLDESHLYSESAKSRFAALDRLRPAARVGLTATPTPTDNVIHRYTLRQAIEDQLVKAPVIAMRAEGYQGDDERGQLRDAKVILDRKAREYLAHEQLHPDAKPIRPIMLVACADTAHADDVAEFLAGSVFGDPEAVLTIHSKGLTDAIEAELARVQEPDSKVRAIVQVDMLTEGWNVHNVAVLVPLRSLQSKTLTEQLIGRGLRLPYGKPTGNTWVDSLDIIWHVRVRSVLESKGIDNGRMVELAGEGTEPDNPPSPGDQPPVDPPAPDGGSEIAPPGTVPGPVDEVPADIVIDLNPDTPDTGDALVDTTAGLHGGARVIDHAIKDAEEQKPEPKPTEVALVSRDSYFFFPKAILEQKPAQLALSTLDDAWTAKTAAAVSGPISGTLLRQKIQYRDDKGTVRLVDAGSEELADFPLDFEDLVQNVAATIMSIPAIKSGEYRQSNMAQAVPLARRILKLVPGEWTLRRGQDATGKIRSAVLAQVAVAAKSAPVAPKIAQLKLPMRPSYLVPAGEPVPSRHDVPAHEPFVRNRHYTGWQRGLYSAAAFDAFETEFRIATLLDASPKVARWTRLYPADDATIEYAPGRRYFPDFVAIQEDGVHWIIEGKSDAGREDETVQAKREAALTVLREMEGLPGWKDTTWGYVICYQDDVQRANKWEDLIEFSHGRKMWD